MDVLVSALFAGAVAILITVAIERLGGRLGGLVGSMPTTIVPASLGLWSSGVEPFQAAMAAVPAGMLVDAGFLAVWRFLPGRLPPGALGVRLAVMIVASLGAWAVGAALFLAVAGALGAQRAWALGLGATAALVGVGLLLTRNPLPAPGGSRPVPRRVLALRGLLAAVAIGAAVLLGQQGAPLLAGLASVFPAVFLTMMVSLWLAQGEAVPIGAVGPIVIGSASVAVYALAAALCFPLVGPVAGALAAWVCGVVLGTLPAARWLASR